MELVKKILEGDVQAAAKLMREVENDSLAAIEELKKLYPYTARAYIVGITGAPGVGKSTLIDALLKVFRRESMRIGIIAVDPTSPFTGGAILGDRIRMQRHTADEGVFIRSVAIRGGSGGLSKATLGLIHIMSAMGKDVILVETVGTGQAEIEITKIADTSVLILSPGIGDEIQVMKAGILEAADIFVVNKADREGADELKSKLEIMLGRRFYSLNGWNPNVILTEAISAKGVEGLEGEIRKHRDFLVSSGELEKRRQERAKAELIGVMESSIKKCVYQAIGKDVCLGKLANEVAQRKVDPYSAASEILASFMEKTVSSNS